MKNKVFLKGIVTSGLGEASFFMSMEHYKREIKKKLGFDAFPGTLNLKIDKKQIELLRNLSPIRISGYKKDNKTYGSISCYKAIVKNINGVIIIPDLTKHKKNIIEFIAPVHLKSKLKLKDGSKVGIKML